MSEKDLIKQLNSLKTIKADENWKKQIKSVVLSRIENNSYQESFKFPAFAKALADRQVSSFKFLFRPISGMAVASFMVLVIAASLIFSLLMTGSNFYGELLAISQYKHKEIDNNNEEIKFVNREINEEIRKDKEISPLEQINNKEDKKIDSFISISDNGDDLLDNFKAHLTAKINRIWVLALESGDEEAFAIAREAEKLYGEKDYDAALRAINVAEAMLVD